jgi:hypothetical protein
MYSRSSQYRIVALASDSFGAEASSSVDAQGLPVLVTVSDGMPPALSDAVQSVANRSSAALTRAVNAGDMAGAWNSIQVCARPSLSNARPFSLRSQSLTCGSFVCVILGLAVLWRQLERVVWARPLPERELCLGVRCGRLRARGSCRRLPRKLFLGSYPLLGLTLSC